MCLFEGIYFLYFEFVLLVEPYNFYFKILNGRFNCKYCKYMFMILFLEPI